ncbi:MAG: hypothetical protein ABI843_12680 [Dokdonella sp.]
MSTKLNEQRETLAKKLREVFDEHLREWLEDDRQPLTDETLTRFADAMEGTHGLDAGTIKQILRR